MAGYNYGYNQYPTYNTYPQYQQSYQQYPQMQTVPQPQQMQTQPIQSNQQMQNVQQIPQQTSQQQIQNGGFFPVRSREEAFNYPVAPGYSITFKDENSPRLYTKTKGFSSLEEPVFKSYLLMEEDVSASQQQEQTTQAQFQDENQKDEYALRTDLLDALGDIDDLKKEIQSLKKQLRDAHKKPKKQEPIAVEVAEKEEPAEVEE